VEKMERQLRKHISKVRKTKRRKSGEPQPTEEASEDEDSDYEESMEVAGPHRVSVSDKIPAKPMSVEEAILQLEASGGEFMAFINQQTDDVNVVHRKKDGGYGILRRSE
jgi:putative sigma-54 modulation protein